MVRHKETGLAIGVILLAIILLAALSLAIAYGIRAGTAGNSDYKNKTLATSVINQAAYIQRAYDDFYSAGVNTCRVRFYPADAGATDPYTYHYVYDPAYTTVPVQVAPADALVDPAQTFGLRYSLCFGLVHEPGVGGSAVAYQRGHYAVLLPDLKKGVCEQINQTLWGSKSISVAADTFTTWVEYWNNETLWPGTRNQPEACFQTSDGHYIYYKLVFIIAPGYVAYDPYG